MILALCFETFTFSISNMLHFNIFYIELQKHRIRKIVLLSYQASPRSRSQIWNSYERSISDRSCARASRSNVIEDSSVGERSTGKRQYENSVFYTEVTRRAYSVPSPKKAVMHKPVPPKSISVTQMLKLRGSRVSRGC